MCNSTLPKQSAPGRVRVGPSGQKPQAFFCRIATANEVEPDERIQACLHAKPAAATSACAWCTSPLSCLGTPTDGWPAHCQAASMKVPEILHGQILLCTLIAADCRLTAIMGLRTVHWGASYTVRPHAGRSVLQAAHVAPMHAEATAGPRLPDAEARLPQLQELNRLSEKPG